MSTDVSSMQAQLDALNRRRQMMAQMAQQLGTPEQQQVVGGRVMDQGFSPIIRQIAGLLAQGRGNAADRQMTDTQANLGRAKERKSQDALAALLGGDQASTEPQASQLPQSAPVASMMGMQPTAPQPTPSAPTMGGFLPNLQKAAAARQAGVDPSIVSAFMQHNESAMTRDAQQQAPAQPITLSTENVGGFNVLRDNTGKVISSQVPDRIQRQEVTNMTPYQAAQVDLDRQRLELDRTKTKTATGPASITEAERKGAVLGTRLEGALRELESVETDAPGASRPTLTEKAAGMLGEAAANVVRSPNRQRADTAQLDALDAALTLATGAAYTKEQIQALRKSYFPQIGDSADVVTAKERRFKMIVETARIASGRASPSIDAAQPPTQGQPVRVDTPQEAMQLLPGTLFVTPDGRVKVR